MNDEPSPPLKIDARLILESIAATLAFVLAGIAAVNLPDPYGILVPLALVSPLVAV